MFGLVRRSCLDDMAEAFAEWQSEQEEKYMGLAAQFTDLAISRAAAVADKLTIESRVRAECQELLMMADQKARDLLQ